MIANKIQSLISDAMKAHDEIRLSTLRLLSSALNYDKIEKQRELSDEEELVVIKKEAKKRKDAILAYGQLKNERTEELKRREEAELKILQEFLPPETSEDEIKKVVDEFVKNEMQIGQAIGLVKSKLPNADGSLVAKLIKLKLKID